MSPAHLCSPVVRRIGIICRQPLSLAHMCPAEEHQYGEERGDPSSLDLAYVRASAGGAAGTWAPSKLDLVLRSTRRAFGDAMFFTFPEERPLEHRATDRRVGVETASTAEWCGCRSSCSSGCSRSGPPPRRYLQAYYLPTVPVREHRGGESERRGVIRRSYAAPSEVFGHHQGAAL